MTQKHDEIKLVYVVESYEYGIQSVFAHYADALNYVIEEYAQAISENKEWYQPAKVADDLNTLAERGYIEEFISIESCPLNMGNGDYTYSLGEK